MTCKNCGGKGYNTAFQDNVGYDDFTGGAVSLGASIEKVPCKKCNPPCHQSCCDKVVSSKMEPLEKVEELKPDEIIQIHGKHLLAVYVERRKWLVITRKTARKLLRQQAQKSFQEGRQKGIEEAIQKINQLDTREPHTHSYVVCEACGEQRGQISARNVCEELLNNKNQQ